MKTRILLASAALLLAAPAAFAGSPDDPGAHGEIVSNAPKVHKANGTNLGQAIKDYRENVDPDYKVGAAVQEIKDAYGGAPNPANDNGGGND